MTLEIKRFSYTEKATYGVMCQNGIPFAVTLERPWENNEPNISCIPAGRYICKKIISPKFGETFEIQHVTNRTHVLLHKLNTVFQTQGCIGIGEKFTSIDKDEIMDIGESAEGFNEFMSILKDKNEFELLIKEAI